MNEITELLDILDQYNEKIKSYPELRSALLDLNQMVGMDQAKKTAVLQVRFILNHSPGEKILFDDQMLHTVIYGPPGVGKSNLGKILARFYSSLGILKAPTQAQRDPKTLIGNLIHIDLLLCQNNLEMIRRNLHDYIEHIRRRLLSNDSQTLVRIQTDLTNQASFLDEILKLHLSDLPLPRPIDPSPFRVVTRNDFVAGHLGQTALKTMKLLQESTGKVLFIDEAYSMIHGETDSYGQEALAILNLYMSEHPNDLVIIFGGYKEKMESGLFKYQPGLKRRCTWIYELKPYSSEDLASIFQTQLKRHGWEVHRSVNLIKFFQDNHSSFPNFGGDTERLTFYCKLHQHEEEFIKIIGSKKRRVNTNTVTETILRKGFQELLNHRIRETSFLPPPFGLYL